MVGLELGRVTFGPASQHRGLGFALLLLNEHVLPRHETNVFPWSLLTWLPQFNAFLVFFVEEINLVGPH